MSLIKNIADINKSQETLLFKIFESRTPSVCFPQLTNDGDCGPDSFTDSSQGSPKLDFPHSGQSLSPNVFNFDLTAGYEGQTVRPRSQVNPTDLLESSSPSNMFQLKAASSNLMGEFSGDPNLPNKTIQST